MAETPTGELIKASDAHKGGSYACPACKQSFVLRRGKRKRPHFAHKALSPNCTPETALHHSFKTLMHEKIQKHIEQSLPLKIQWDCSNCGEIHTGNLLKKAVKVQLEANLEICRPDIALLDKDGSTIAVIEVVVTHAPEETTLEYYQQNRIAIVIYSLDSDEDIKRLDDEVLKPDNVSLCTNPKCLKCGNKMTKKYLEIIDASCWKCHAPMKVAALSSRLWYLGISDFSDSDIQLANQKGCFLKSQYSNVEKERYIANTCRKCNRFIGNHYLFRDYVSFIELEREELDAGYYCHHCQ